MIISNVIKIKNSRNKPKIFKIINKKRSKTNQKWNIINLNLSKKKINNYGEK